MNIPKRFYLSLLLGLISLIIAMFFEFSNETIFQACIFITIILCGIALTSYWNKPILVEKIKTSIDVKQQPFQKSELMVSVSAALYAILAGLSIAKTMEFTFEIITKDFDNFGSGIHLISSDAMIQILNNHFNEILMAVAFLITAIPFYHGAMVYLSDKSRNIELESTKGLALHFAVLFTQAIILLGISVSLISLTFVITLLITLTILDTVWIIVGQKTRNKPPIGWLCLNLGFVSALIFTLHLNSIPDSLYALVIISIIRTAIDYTGFRKVYSDIKKEINS